MAITTFVIKRKRRAGQADERWVEIGTCVINVEQGSGTIYLSDRDENWRLFLPTTKKKPVVDDPF